MRFNSEEIKKIIFNEVDKIVQENKWACDVNFLSEHVYKSLILKEEKFELIDPIKWSSENAKNINEKETLKKVNLLNEELKRMRELADFRNPFFKIKN